MAIGLGTWAVALAPALVARVVTALGITITTLVGVNIAFDQMKQYAANQLNSAPAAAIQLANLAGFGEGVALILGAITFVISLWTATTATRMVFK